MNYKRIIGIDPDIEKSGFALLDIESRSVEVQTLPFFDLLGALMRNYNPDTLVVIEAMWKTKNWHYTARDSKAVVAKKGLSVGRNQQVGILLAEFCEVTHVNYKLQPPLRKIWRGKDRKITQAEIVQFMPIGRTNQEGRDAALLAWCAANLPIRITHKTTTTK